MSSATRRRVLVCAGNDATTTESSSPARPPSPSIPTDLLLDILARTDAATVVRCAATSKPVRRAILGPGFRGAIAALCATDTGGGGFNPELLLGFTYADRDDPVRVAQAGMGMTPTTQNLRFDASLLETFQPVSVRGSLVVLRRRPELGGGGASDLRVCNSLTGDMVRLPPSAVVRDDDYHAYPPALLTVGDGGRSFELLVAAGGIARARLRAQTFSSKQDGGGGGGWAAAVDIGVPVSLHHRPDGSNPVVLVRGGGGGTVVHWLCCYGRLDTTITALHTGTAQATQIEMPRGYLGRVRHSQYIHTGLLLAASADGRLGLLVSETFDISMWTLEEEGFSASAAAARWTRQVVVRREAICREAGAGPSYSVHFMAFGERSGAVMLLIEGVGLVRLNLGAREAVVLDRDFEIASRFHFRLCLHETDLSSLLQGMKLF